jgi:hypothetical protein
MSGTGHNYLFAYEQFSGRPRLGPEMPKTILHKYEDYRALRAKTDRAPIGRRTVRGRAVTPSHAIRGVAAFIIVVGLLIAPPVLDSSDNFFREFASLAPGHVAPLSFIPAAQAQTVRLANSPSDPVKAYDNALDRFKSILRERRAQINSNRRLPNLPGQALYVARNEMISTYKDLTDALPSRIGRPNGLGIPPAYFDADNEPLLDEYKSLFDLMQAPPGNAQKSDTPFRDVFDLGRAIGRAKGLGAVSAEVAGRISLGIFFAETNGKQNMGNARSNTYKGSLQTGVSEDRNGQIKWAAIKQLVIALDPALGDRDAREEARIGNLDHRLNHWTAVRDGLMNAHAELFSQITMIVKVLANPIDQMKFFELIQIIPSPTKAALRSGDLANYKISDPRIMRYLRNNSIFTFGHTDRARTSATLREVLNAMWLFNGVFERALSKFNDIKAQ